MELALLLLQLVKLAAVKANANCTIHNIKKLIMIISAAVFCSQLAATCAISFPSKKWGDHGYCSHCNFYASSMVYVPLIIVIIVTTSYYRDGPSQTVS